MADLENLIGRSNTAGKPAAGIAGRLWYDTTLDKLQRDSGSVWEDAERADAAAAGGFLYPSCGRLTLATGVPVTTTDQTAKTTLYFSPFRGNQIALYNGTDAWEILTFAELSLNISAYTASKPYDIWVYNNSGAAALESTVWTNTTTRATALTTQDGILVKTGATTRRYVGTIYITAAGGQTEDSANNRFVWNYYNRVTRILSRDLSGGNHTYSGDTRSWANDAANALNFVIGQIEDAVTATFSCRVITGAGEVAVVTIENGSAAILITAAQQSMVAHAHALPALGLNSWHAQENATGTVDFYYDQSYFKGSMLG